MKGICVFWIPTMYHQTIQPVEDWQDIKDEDISDEVGCVCKLSLEQKEVNIIQVKLSFEKEENLTFTLRRTDDHRNGLFKYEFDVNEESFEIVRMALVNPIYHFIKGFYHKHQYHSTDCDSILDAYVAPMHTDQVNIDCPDNEPLIFYLKQYEKRFKDFADQLEYDAGYLEQLEKKPEYKDILYREKFEKFNQRCIDVQGEVIYYRALFNSKHNHSYRIIPHRTLNHECNCESSYPSKEPSCELYKSALNTESSITRIKLIAERVKSSSQNKRGNATFTNIIETKMANDLLTQLALTTSEIEDLSKSSLSLQNDVKKTLAQSESSSTLSIRLGWLGVILGAFSLLLAIAPFFKGNEFQKVEETQKSILEKINSMEERQQKSSKFQHQFSPYTDPDYYMHRAR